MITIKGFIGNAVSRIKYKDIETYIMFLRTSEKKLVDIEYGDWINNYPYYNFVAQLVEAKPLRMQEGEICHALYISDNCDLRSMFFIKAQYTEFDESYLYKALEDAVEYDFSIVVFQFPAVKKHEDLLAKKVLHVIQEFEKNHPDVNMTIMLSIDCEQEDAKNALLAEKIPFS